MEKIKVIINGIMGNMGQTVRNLVEADESLELVAGIDGRICEGDFPFKTFGNIYNCNVKADVVIDFSVASCTDDLLHYCKEKKLPLVLCTTGLSEETLKLVEESSKIIPIFKSANMSIGINVINNLLKKVSPFLYDINFDIEIIEKHHNRKVDAPSGTALLLADTIKDTINKEQRFVYDRSSVRQKREKEEIGIHAVRGGTIVGEHSVIFAGNNEIIEIQHQATSREVFAVGAINACKFLANEEPGIYDMDNLINKVVKF
ncbi:MAG: 4-hydroxy-tetrahydrodipicolinate reductase [Lachnospirales bacterium]